MNLRHIFFVCNPKRTYLPRWMYLVKSLLYIVEGLLNLFLVWFGVALDFTTPWCGYMLRAMMTNYKKEQARKKAQMAEDVGWPLGM